MIPSTDPVAIVQTQVAYWIAEDFTPAECLAALGYPLNSKESGMTVLIGGEVRRCTWGSVMDAAMVSYRWMAARVRIAA